MTSKTLKLIKRNKWRFIQSCLSDLGFSFFFLYAYWQIIGMKIFPLLLKLNTALSGAPQINAGLQEQARAVEQLTNSAEFLSNYAELVQWLLVFAGVIFVLAIVFNSSSYYLAAKIVDKKTRFFSYMIKSSIISLGFYLLVMGSLWLSVYLSVIGSKMFFSPFNQTVITLIVILLVLFIRYFWLVCLVQVRKYSLWSSVKRAFSEGVKNFFGNVIVLVGGAALVSAMVAISYALFSLHMGLFLAGLLLLVIPSVSIARILFFVKAK